MVIHIEFVGRFGEDLRVPVFDASRQTTARGRSAPASALRTRGRSPGVTAGRDGQREFAHGHRRLAHGAQTHSPAGANSLDYSEVAEGGHPRIAGFREAVRVMAAPLTDIEKGVHERP